MIEPLADGRLCLSSVGELARVANPTNFAEVLPRFFGCSSREAREVAAAISPREAPPARTVVTSPFAPWLPAAPATTSFRPSAEAPEVAMTTAIDFESVRAHEPAPCAKPIPVRAALARTEIEPLSADLRRLHVTVSDRLLRKLDAARDGLAHSIPYASAEQVLEAALDLLLEKQARARGQVKKPRAVAPPPEPATELAPIRHRRAGQRAAIPAAVRRAVWARDGGRCSWPLDSGGCCSSTHRLELDHVVPWANGGEATVPNLRVICHLHNRVAARAAFGTRVLETYAGRT